MIIALGAAAIFVWTRRVQTKATAVRVRSTACSAAGQTLRVLAFDDVAWAEKRGIWVSNVRAGADRRGRCGC